MPFLKPSAVFIIGNVLAALAFNALRKERERRAQLEVAQQELESNIQVIKENEKRLARSQPDFKHRLPVSGVEPGLEQCY